MELNLSRPIAFFDLETTGTDVAVDRIVEISILIVQPSGEEERHTMRINPTVPIPAEASAIHGIYDADVANEPTFAEKAEEVYNLMNPCDLAGYNSNRFDVPLLIEEFLRVDINFSLNGRRLIDVMRIFMLMEKRTLEAAYQFYCGKTLENAHSAEADTNATYEVMKAQLDRYDELQNDMDALEKFIGEEQIIDTARRFAYINGVPSFNFGKHKGKPIAQVLKEEPGYYGWMLNSNFPLHTKQKLKEFKLTMKL